MSELDDLRRKAASLRSQISARDDETRELRRSGKLDPHDKARLQSLPGLIADLSRELARTEDDIKRLERSRK